MALKVHDLWLGEPGRTLKVRATTSDINRLSFPTWETVAWDIPARAGLPPVTITWHNDPTPGLKDRLAGVLKDAPEKDRGLWQFAGTLIVGTKGMIHTTGHNMWFELLPKDRFAGVQTARPEKVPDSRGPEQDWFAACRGGPRPWANFDYAAALNEFLMLGNLATQFEGPLEYDPTVMTVLGNPAADALLRPHYRPGWTL